MDRKRTGIAISIFAAITFGLYPAAAKATYAQGANISFVVVVTTVSRAFALIAFCASSGRRIAPRREQVRSTILAGICQAGSILGIIGSLAFLPAPVTIILMFTHTMMLLAWMWWKGELLVTAAVVASTAAALLGVSFVVDVWHHLGALSVPGICLALFAAVATAIRLYLFGKEVQEDHPAVVGARVFGIAALATTLLFLGMPPIAPAAVQGYFWLLICSLALIAGTFGMFYGIAYLGSFQWSLMAKLEPVFTATFAYLIVSEVLRPVQYFGMALVIGSLAFYQLLSRPDPSQDRAKR